MYNKTKKTKKNLRFAPYTKQNQTSATELKEKNDVIKQNQTSATEKKEKNEVNKLKKRTPSVFSFNMAPSATASMNAEPNISPARVAAMQSVARSLVSTEIAIENSVASPITRKAPIIFSKTATEEERFDCMISNLCGQDSFSIETPIITTIIQLADPEDSEHEESNSPKNK